MGSPARATIAMTPRMRGLMVALAVLVVLAVATVVSFLSQQTERNAIVGLPDAERKAFYERTRQTLETTCSAGSEGLASYCAEQAELIVKFPECDEACRKLAEAYGPRPTR